MTADYYSRLKDATTKSERERLFSTMERDLTPLEIDGLRRPLRELGAEFSSLQRKSAIFHLLKEELPRAYEVSRPWAGARFFSDGQGSPASKTLIICFTALYERPLQQTSHFLQYLPSQSFDILMFQDERRHYYRKGIHGLDMPLHQLSKVVGGVISALKYRRLICYGTSLGALAALVCGHILKADRSIAVGPVYPWDLDWIEKGMQIAAFDPLCSCRTYEAETMVAVYSEGHNRDASHAERLRRNTGARIVVTDTMAKHNVIMGLYAKDRLREFLAEMFGFDPADRPLRKPAKPPGLVLRLTRRARRVLKRIGLQPTGAKRPRYSFPSVPQNS